MQTDHQLFIPITKIDAVHRMVYGLATAEKPDRAGEICDYAKSKPFYEKWSSGIAKATDGKSLGNVRAMHGSVAAGVLKGIAFNDDAKQIEIGAKIVDDNEWKKVEEGVYTGFSQGGRVVERFTDPANNKLKRYVAEPFEISLVDLPCLPDCTFELIKSDGSKETRHFKTTTAEPTDPVEKRAHEMAKAAGTPDAWGTLLEAARAALQTEEALAKAGSAEPAAKPADPAPTAEPQPNSEDLGVSQKWVASDGKSFEKKADAMAHNESLIAKAAADAAAKPATDVLADIKAELEKRGASGEGAVAVAKSAAAATAAEPSPAQAEPAPKADPVVEPVAKSAAAAVADGAAAGAGAAAASADDKDGDEEACKAQQMHDLACSMGAKCEHAAKGAGDGDLAKALSLVTAERTALQKGMADLTSDMKDVLARIKNIEAQPIPGGPIKSIAVTKAMDSNERPANMPNFEDMTPDELAREFVKASHRNPQRGIPVS